MKSISTAFLLVITTIFFFSCGGDDIPEKGIEDFTGTYDTWKYKGVNADVDRDTLFASKVALEVIVDPLNSDNLLISNLSIPVDENGAYGPDFIRSDMQVELSFDNDEIFFIMQPFLINGIALPCTFIGPKID